MSSTTKKPIIDPKSKAESEALSTTADLYREYDAFLREQRKREDGRRNRLAESLAEQAPELVMEIDEKREQEELKRVELVEFIYKESKEEFIEFKKLTKLSYEDVVLLHKRVIENKKPWWQKTINMFR